MMISIVTSLYNSENDVEVFCSKVKDAIQTIPQSFEIILVNDCSPDSSLQKALETQKIIPEVKIIDLARNFGQHKALLVGLKHTVGDFVFMMDSDLEEDPSEIIRFFNEYNKQDGKYDVIYGVQQQRKGRLFERVTGSVFYKIFSSLSGLHVEKNPTPFRLMTRRYVNSLCKFEESEFFFLGISILAGFKQLPLTILKVSSSVSTYNITRKLSQFITAITSFSNMPLIYIFYLGTAISSFSFLYLAYLLGRYIIVGVGVEGWTTLVVSIWLVGGLTLFCIGIVGLYLAKIFNEVKKRPFAIIKEIYEKHVD